MAPVQEYPTKRSLDTAGGREEKSGVLVLGKQLQTHSLQWTTTLPDPKKNSPPQFPLANC